MSQQNMNTPAESGNKRTAFNALDKENVAPCVTLEKEQKSGSLSVCSSKEEAEGVIVISLDGNIGAGKSTLLKAVADAVPEVEVVVEPVGKCVDLLWAYSAENFPTNFHISY